MAANSFSGAWKRTTLPDNRVPLKPGIDPEHAKPTDSPDPFEQDRSGAPQLPTEWSGGQYLQDNVASGYVDLTPVDHTFGLGTLPGVDQRTAQAVGGRERNVDLGAMDARDYDRPAYQEDGSTHTDVMSGDLQGESPETLRYLEKGVGVGIDPYARSNRDIRHHPTGPAQYDMRWYGAEFRPRYAVNAQGSPQPAPAVAGRSQYQSPYGRNTILRPDNWANPVVRRTAADWDQPFTVDQETETTGGNFGLGSWGL